MDENIQDVVDNKEPEVKQPEISPIEQRAMEMGWRPKEQFEGDEEDFIDAKEFVRRKPLFDKIEHQGKQLKQLTRALDGLKQHYTKVEETAVQRALQQLKLARKEALTDGDGDRFEQLDDAIKDTEKQLKQIEVAKNTPVIEETEPHPDFVAFQTRNKWYQADPKMTEFADKLGLGLHATGMNPTEVLQEIERQVRQRFPDKFRNKNKDEAPDVETSRQGKVGSKSDSFELTEQERKVMNDFVRQKIMTKEEYIADLKKIKGIK